MLSKLIAWGHSRKDAIRKMRTALKEYIVLGVKTNIGFLSRVMENEEFMRGEFDTGFIERHPQLLSPSLDDVEPALIAAALKMRNSTREVATSGQTLASNWKLFARKSAVSRNSLL
jgi:Acetyl/propionyl-CoA carboxylase, alpha subunit